LFSYQSDSMLQINMHNAILYMSYYMEMLIHIDTMFSLENILSMLVLYRIMTILYKNLTNLDFLVIS
jgi:hypothetical protein